MHVCLCTYVTCKASSEEGLRGATLALSQITTLKQQSYPVGQLCAFLPLNQTFASDIRYLTGVNLINRYTNPCVPIETFEKGRRQ